MAMRTIQLDAPRSTGSGSGAGDAPGPAFASSSSMVALPASSVGESELQSLARQVARSKKVAFIVGAGISTASGIPDFRSSTTGLFASLREKNPELKIASGKDLFHSNLFQREDTTRAFYMMIAELKRMADEAEPTEMHKLMKDLDAAGKLFRIYTQNIDALEAKAGLSYGLGEWKQTGGGPVSPSKKGKGKAKAAEGGKSPSRKGKGKQRAVADDNNALEDPASSQESRSQQERQNMEQPQGVEGGDYDGQPVASTSRLSATVVDHFSPASQSRSNQDSSQPATAYVLETSEGEHLADVSVASTLSSLSSLGEDETEDEGGMSTREIPETPEDGPTPPEPPQTVVEDGMTMDLDSSDDESALDLLSLLASQTAKQEEPKPSASEAVPSLSQLCLADGARQASPQPDESLVAPTASQAAKTAPVRRTLTIPRVIPLHGTLDEMHCPKCTHTASTQQHLAILASGHSAYCPSCVALDNSRTALGERSRGIGVLKVSVVLYGEEHKQASRVGEITEKDLLKSARPDFLIVAGTTLKIPGVKKLVRELSRLVKQLNEFEEQEKDAEGNGTGVWHKRVTHVPRVIFMNMEAPTPEKSWNDVFDIHLQGDIQTFASMVRQELANPTRKPSTSAMGGALAPPPASAPPAFQQSAPQPSSSGLARAVSFSGGSAQPPTSKIKLALENKHWIVSVPATKPAPAQTASLSTVEEAAESPSAPSSSAPAALEHPRPTAVPVERFFSSKPSPAPSPAPFASAPPSQALDQPTTAAAPALAASSKARRPARQRPPTAAQIAAQYQSPPSPAISSAKGKGRAVLQQPPPALAKAKSAEGHSTISAHLASAASTAAAIPIPHMAPYATSSQGISPASEGKGTEPGTDGGAFGVFESRPSAEGESVSTANAIAARKVQVKAGARARPGKSKKKAATSRAGQLNKQKVAGKTAAVKDQVVKAKKAAAKGKSRKQPNAAQATDAIIHADAPAGAGSAPVAAAAALLPVAQVEPGTMLTPQPAISVPAKGWKGYVLAPETAPKNFDYWSDRVPEGSKRRRSGLLPNPPTPARTTLVFPAAAAAADAPALTAGEGSAPTPVPVAARIAAVVEAPAPLPSADVPADAPVGTAGDKQKIPRARSKSSKSSKNGSTKKNKKGKSKGKDAQKAGATRQSPVLPKPVQAVQDALTATTAASTPPSLTSDDSTEMDTEEVRSVTEAALASGPTAISVPDAPLDKGKGRAVAAPTAKPTCERTAPLVIGDSQPSQPEPRYYTPVPSEAGSVGEEVRAFQTWFNELQELDAIVHLAERRSTRSTAQGRGTSDPAIEQARLVASQKRIAAELERSTAEQKKRAAEEEKLAEEVRSLQNFLELDAFMREREEASEEAERARTSTVRTPTAEQVAAREKAWREFVHLDRLVRLADGRDAPEPRTCVEAGPSTSTSAAAGLPAIQVGPTARDWAPSESSSAKRVKTAAPAPQAPPKKAAAKRGKKASRARK